MHRPRQSAGFLSLLLFGFNGKFLNDFMIMNMFSEEAAMMLLVDSVMMVGQ